MCKDWWRALQTPRQGTSVIISTDSGYCLNCLVHCVNLPVIAKLPVPEVKNELLCYLAEIEQLVLFTMTATMLQFEELCELVDVTDAVLPGTDTYLPGIIAVYETLFGELYEVHAIVCPEDTLVSIHECLYDFSGYLFILLEIVHYLGFDVVHQLFQISITLLVVRAV